MATLTSATDYLEEALLDHVFNGTTYTPPANVYAALFSTAPSDAGGGTEATGGSYARQAISFGAAATRASTTTADLDWTSMPAGTWTHVGIFDAVSSGNLLLWGELDSSATTASTDPLTIATGDLTVTFAAGAISDYLAGELLDHVLRSESWTPPTTTELALYDTAVELTGGSYARQTLSWAAASGGSIAVDAGGAFTNLPAADIDSFAYCEDTASGGAVLWSKALGVPRTVTTGQGATWATGQFTATMD